MSETQTNSPKDDRKMITKQVKAQATLIGLAKTGVLAARTPSACHAINTVGEMTDYREEVSEDFTQMIRSGLIRTDAEWSKGAEKYLCTLVDSL